MHWPAMWSEKKGGDEMAAKFDLKTSSDNWRKTVRLEPFDGSYNAADNWQAIHKAKKSVIARWTQKLDTSGLDARATDGKVKGASNLTECSGDGLDQRFRTRSLVSTRTTTTIANNDWRNTPQQQPCGSGHEQTRTNELAEPMQPDWLAFKRVKACAGSQSKSTHSTATTNRCTRRPQ